MAGFFVGVGMGCCGACGIGGLRQRINDRCRLQAFLLSADVTPASTQGYAAIFSLALPLVMFVLSRVSRHVQHHVLSSFLSDYFVIYPA